MRSRPPEALRPVRSGSKASSPPPTGGDGLGYFLRWTVCV
jgi:hypothetical protein